MIMAAFNLTTIVRYLPCVIVVCFQILKFTVSYFNKAIAAISDAMAKENLVEFGL